MKVTFSDRAYQITRQIPRGRVATYGQIATLAGNPRAARAVGSLMKHNPDIPMTPCHRVVAFDGELNGYSAGDGKKTKLDMLKQEGVVFLNGKVDLEISQWIRKISND